MHIARLTLQQFTSFKEVTLEFAPGVNVIIGENATGKSHALKLLYAVSEAVRRPVSGEGLDARKGEMVVLECDGLGSRARHRLFDEVQSRVAELRGVAPLVLIYDPYLTTDEIGALRDEAWVEGTLQSIGELSRPTVEGASLVAVINGTRFATTDHDELPDLSAYPPSLREAAALRHRSGRSFLIGPLCPREMRT